MKVFISWSKEPSKTIAAFLADWLQQVVQIPDVWISQHDLEVGQQWRTEIDNALAAHTVGIFVVTKTNQREPWLMFEAGAISKIVSEKPRVMTYLVDMAFSDLERGSPLIPFHSAIADRNGTWELVKSLNKLLEKPRLEPAVDASFAKWWPDLEKKLGEVRQSEAEKGAQPVGPPKTKELVMLEELLDLVRKLQSSSSPSPSPRSSSLADAVVARLDAGLSDLSDADLARLSRTGNLSAVSSSKAHRLLNGIERLRAHGTVQDLGRTLTQEALRISGAKSVELLERSLQMNADDGEEQKRKVDDLRESLAADLLKLVTGR